MSCFIYNLLAYYSETPAGKNVIVTDNLNIVKLFFCIQPKYWFMLKLNHYTFFSIYYYVTFLSMYLIILPWIWSIIYLCLRCVLFDKTFWFATLGGLEHVLSCENVNVHVQSCKYEQRYTDVLSRSRKHLFIGSVETLFARNNRSIRSGGLWV